MLSEKIYQIWVTPTNFLLQPNEFVGGWDIGPFIWMNICNCWVLWGFSYFFCFLFSWDIYLADFFKLENITFRTKIIFK